MKDRSSNSAPYRMLREDEEERDPHDVPPVSKSPDALRNTLIGSAYVAMGQTLFGTNDALVKFSKLKVDQLLFFRFLIQFSIAVVWWMVAKPTTCTHWYGDKPYVANIWIRGLCYSLCMVSAYYAFIKLPVGDATAIWHQAPIVTALIARVWLKEKLPKSTPFIVIMGVVGTCFITQPTFLTAPFSDEHTHTEPLRPDGVVCIVIALFTWSISVILVRTAKDSHFIQLEIVSAGETTFFSVPLLITLNEFVIHNAVVGDMDFSDWRFDARSIAILCILGVFGFIALSLNVVGFQYGDPTRVAWVSYCYQVYMFDDVPNRFELIGLVFVFLSCCLTICEEMYYNYKKTEHSDDYDYRNAYAVLNPQSDLYDSANKGLHVNML